MGDQENENLELTSLEARVDELIRTVENLASENRALKSQHATLASEQALLIEKTEMARTRVEAMIARLKAMESRFKAGEYLNRQMKELRDSGKIIGAERIAVLAALNIANEFQEYKRQKEGYTSNIGDSLKRIQAKIAGAIMKGRQMDMTEPMQGRLDA